MRRKHGVLRLVLVEAVVPDVHVDLFRDRQVLSALLKLTRERENPPALIYHVKLLYLLDLGELRRAEYRLT